MWNMVARVSIPILVVVLSAYGVSQNQEQEGSDSQVGVQQAEQEEITLEGARNALQNLVEGLEEFRALGEISPQNVQVVGLDQFTADSSRAEGADPAGEQSEAAAGEVAGGGGEADVSEAQVLLDEIDRLIVGVDQYLVEDLRTEIQNNPEILQAIQAEGIEVEDVFAVDIMDGDQVVVYYREVPEEESDVAGGGGADVDQEDGSEDGGEQDQ